LLDFHLFSTGTSGFVGSLFPLHIQRSILRDPSLRLQISVNLTIYNLFQTATAFLIFARVIPFRLPTPARLIPLKPLRLVLLL